jgi:hypothetical protein
MSKKQNPKLKEGDRIVLIYMPGEDIDTGTKGKVIEIGQQPSSNSEFDYLYKMEWYDDEGKVIDSLSLLPQSDTWILDPEFSQKNLQEARFTDLDDLIRHHEWSKLFKKADLQYVLDFLMAIRDLGVVNMLQSGQFLGETKKYLTAYFDLYQMGRNIDKDDKELIKKIIDMGEKVRNIMILASMTDLERQKIKLTSELVTKRLNRLTKEILQWYIKSFY